MNVGNRIKAIIFSNDKKFRREVVGKITDKHESIDPVNGHMCTLFVKEDNGEVSVVRNASVIKIYSPLETLVERLNEGS